MSTSEQGQTELCKHARNNLSGEKSIAIIQTAMETVYLKNKVNDNPIQKLSTQMCWGKSNGNPVKQCKTKTEKVKAKEKQMEPL